MQKQGRGAVEKWGILRALGLSWIEMGQNMLLRHAGLKVKELKGRD